jgi:hypothetical protein
MAELGEPLPDGTLPPPQDEAANPSQRDTISPQLGPLTSPNHIGPEQSEPLFLSSLFTPTDGISGPADLHAEGTIRRQTIQSPSQGTGAKDFSLLDDRTSLGMFLYGDRFKYLPPRQWLAHNEFSKREVEEAPRPLLQLDFGNWSFSVLLSAAAFSR